MGTTLLYLGLLVFVPLSAVVLKTATLPLARVWELATSERALASYRLTFGAALVAAVLNLFFGLLVAWVLVQPATQRAFRGARLPCRRLRLRDSHRDQRRDHRGCDSVLDHCVVPSGLEGNSSGV
jgi:ABC-type sulfate transport system permease subunit